MQTHALSYPTLINTIWKDQTMLRNAFLVIAGSVLLFVSAKIKIPFYPVPLTMQTFVVLALGMVYGWKLGALTVAFYLFEGALGLPVFTGTPEKGIGLAYMVGPTGGYLLGFVVSAGLVGYLAERGWDRSWLKTFAAMVLGNAVIYALGVCWLGSVIGWDKPLYQYGVQPFIPGDLVKIAMAILILPAAWKIVKK